MKSSSFHTLNADTGLNKLQSKLYFLFNRLNNHLFPEYHSHKLQMRPLNWNTENLDFQSLGEKSSPSRKLIDLFFKELNWKKLKEDLGGEINIVDTGCGKGEYFLKLREFSNHQITTYTGVDLFPHKNWEKLKSEYSEINNFYGTDSRDIDKHLEGSNLVISISAIEHFPEDLTYFKKISNYIEKKDSPILQIHLIPAISTLDLYQYHGIRQYNPRTMGSISDLFPNASFAHYYNLGGRRSYQAHYDWITKPILIDRCPDPREEKSQEFSNLVNQSIIEDFKDSEAFPTFYAFVIGHNFNNIEEII